LGAKHRPISRFGIAGACAAMPWVQIPPLGPSKRLSTFVGSLLFFGVLCQVCGTSDNYETHNHIQG